MTVYLQVEERVAAIALGVICDLSVRIAQERPDQPTEIYAPGFGRHHLNTDLLDACAQHLVDARDAAAMGR